MNKKRLSEAVARATKGLDGMRDGTVDERTQKRLDLYRVMISEAAREFVETDGGTPEEYTALAMEWAMLRFTADVADVAARREELLRIFDQCLDTNQYFGGSLDRAAAVIVDADIEAKAKKETDA